MTLLSRAFFSLLIVGLNFNPAFRQQSSFASTRARSQSSDEAAVRSLTEQYGHAIAASDFEKIRQFWNPQSFNLNSGLRPYRDMVMELRIEILSLKVTRLDIAGDKAVSHLTTDERRLDKKTGAILVSYDPLLGSCRSLEWVRTSAGWKIEREFLVQDEIAVRLDEAASDQARAEILEKERIYFTNVLLRSLSNRGLRFLERGDHEAAARCYRLHHAISEKLGDKVGVAGAFLNYSLLHYRVQEYEEALTNLRQSLLLYEETGLKFGVARVLDNMASAYRALGDYRQAFDCAQKSLRLCEEEKNRRGLVFALSELSIIYGHQNNDRQALAFLEKALAIAQELADPIRIATLRHDIAVNYKDLGLYDKALAVYQELLKQTEGAGDMAGGAMIRDQIGSILARQGKYEEALNYHRQALSVFKATSQAFVVTLNNISSVYLEQAKYDQALPLAEQAVSQSRQRESPLTLWFALTNLGYSHLGLNHTSDAQQAFAEAVSIVEKLRTQTAGGADERQRYFEGGLRAHHGLLSALVKVNQPREALVLAERAKARVLLDALQQGRVSVQKAMTAEEERQESRLKSELVRLNVQLSRTSHSNKPDASRAETERRLEAARLNYEAFQNSLYAAHPELKVHRGEAPIIKADELAALLPDASSALLEYVVADDKTFLFTITKPAGKAEPEVHVYTLPIKREELAAKTEAFRQRLAGRDLGFRAAGVKLYDLLLKPAEAQLKGKTNLVIAPDSTLWDLPFQALPTRTSNFLIEEAAISYAPSLTVLREMTSRRKNQVADTPSTTLLALGNPLLGSDTISRAALTLRDARFDALPEAEQEVKALGRLYGPSRSKVYIREEAREDRVKSEAGRAKILHFATHGMLNNASPMYSHLVMAGGGANDDGLLEAWELMQLDLKADLAVLSACETARGRIGAGEGMIGLSWAMFIAGVPSTVVSQWKVEAAGTRDLMVNFHRALISPGSARSRPTKAEALRDAALKVMRLPETRHPFYWAGFVLVGDGR